MGDVGFWFWFGCGFCDGWCALFDCFLWFAVLFECECGGCDVLSCARFGFWCLVDFPGFGFGVFGSVCFLAWLGYCWIWFLVGLFAGLVVLVWGVLGLVVGCGFGFCFLGFG